MGVFRVRMFAGPNGSGKSELINRLKDSDLPLGPVVNADVIFKRLKSSGFIDFKDFSLSGIKQESWDLIIKEREELSSRIKKVGKLPEIQIRENMLICDEGKLNAYLAALVADFMRYLMVEQKQSFSFETVMSHPSKISFLKFAKDKGYKTYLYFIATDDPEININRVKNRVQKGGHDVSENKVRSRYHRSIDLVYEALRASDRAYILDSSKRRSSVLFEKKNDGKGYLKVKNYPRWFEKSVIEKLN